MTDKINLCYIPNPIKITEYRVPFIIAIPHLAHFWLKILGSRPLNKPNPGSRKTCWRPSLESRFGKHTLAKNGSVFLINTSFIYFLLTSFFVPCCKLERVFPARIYGSSARCVRQKPERKNEIPYFTVRTEKIRIVNYLSYLWRVRIEGEDFNSSKILISLATQ